MVPSGDSGRWLESRWLLTRGEDAWHEFVERVQADARRVAQGQSSQMVSQLEVQALPDEHEWSDFLARFPRLLAELALASVCDTFQFRPLNYVQDIAPRPLRIVHGDTDESVPIAQSWELYGRAQQVRDLQILRDAPHCCWDTQWEEEVFALSVEWFELHL